MRSTSACVIIAIESTMSYEESSIQQVPDQDLCDHCTFVTVVHKRETFIQDGLVHRRYLISHP